VGGLEPAAHLHRELHRAAQGEGPALELGTQRLPFQEFEDQKGRPVMGAHVEDGEDVGVGEGGDGSRLVLEALQAVGARLIAGADDLDRDVAPQARIAGTVDLPHAPRAEELDELIRTELSPGGQRHCPSEGRNRAHYGSAEPLPASVSSTCLQSVFSAKKVKACKATSGTFRQAGQRWGRRSHDGTGE
jgi:hypothetical protein